MQRRLLAFAGAIALLLAGSLLLIYRVTSPTAPERSPAPSAPAPSAPARGSAPDPPPLATGWFPPAGAPQAPTAPPVVPLENVPIPVPEAPPPWLEGASRSLAPTLEATPLNPLKPFVAAGMGTLQRRVAECDREAPPGAPRARVGRQVTLTLHFETLDNQLRILDATPSDMESSSDWRVQCAQDKLRGQLIPAPSRKGQFFEVPFVLNL